MPLLVLASASPRRAELLKAAGISFDVMMADVDESVRRGEGADGYVRRLAESKARVIAERCPGRFVLGADTVVVVDTAILGKPVDEDDARRMLGLLSGRSHEVLTAVCLVGPTSVRTELARTTVQFAPLTAAEIEWYVASGEPSDKAGAYAVQGLASRFVTRLEGSYSNVVGLPVSVVYRMCAEAGIQVGRTPDTA